MKKIKCPVELSLTLIANKWKILIIRELMDHGKRRFNELQKSLITVTQKMLTQNLRELEADKIITRTVYPVVPPKVEYELSEIGWKMMPVFTELKKFGNFYKELNDEEK